MSIDAIYKHKFYMDPSQSVPYQSEKQLGQYVSLLIRDNQGIERDQGFTCKVTTHRVNLTIESGYKTHLEVPMKSITNVSLEKKGLIHKKVYIVLATDKGVTFELYHPQIEDIHTTINASLNSKVWQVADKPTSTFYSGLGDIKSQLKAEVNQTRAIVSSSTGDVQSLIDKSEKLKEIITYLKKNVTNDSQKTEIDDILSNIDNVSIVTKEEAGKNFYVELAQTIYQVSKELLNRYHGIASLVDVFYITNEKRKISLISPDDLLKACSKFEQLNLPIRLREISKGLKVIQDVNFNSEEDFKKNIGPYVDEDEGITAEGLSRRTKIPLLLAISKLELSLEKGKVIIDDSIEGKRYFHNFIL